jgi:hypothetical protein
MTLIKILPRQGEVAPKATEGADGDSVVVVLPPPPSGCACHLPLAGEDLKATLTTRAIPIRGSR